MQSSSWKAVALVLAGIVLGCAANVVQGVQAQAPAPLPPGAKQWQQYCVVVEDSAELDRVVRAAGTQAFELATASVRYSNTDDYIACFKRQVP